MLTRKRGKNKRVFIGVKNITEVYIRANNDFIFDPLPLLIFIYYFSPVLFTLLL